MSNSIAKASLILTADSGGLNQGLSDSEGKLKSWGQRQQKQADAVGKQAGKAQGKGMSDALAEAGEKGGKKGRLNALLSVGAGVLGIAATAAAAVGVLVTSFGGLSDSIARTTKQARELGVGVEGFSALEHAAKIAGATTDDLAGAVSTLEANLSSADGARYFDQLGLSAEQLRKLPTDEAVARIADALNGIGDPVERARLSLAVFGDRAVQLGPLLEKGGAGIRHLADEARRTGVAFDGVSAAKVQAAREAVARMGASWQGLMNSVAVAAAPWVVWGVKALSSLGGVWDYLKGLGAAVQANVIAPILNAAAPIVDAISNVSAAFASWASSVADAVGPYVTGTLEGVYDTLTWLSDGWSSAWEAMGEAASAASEWAYEAASSALDAVGIDSKAVWKAIGDGIGWLKDRFADLWGYVRSFWDWIFKRSKGGDALRAAADQIAKAAEAGPAAERVGKDIGDRMAEGVKSSQLNNVKAPLLKAVTDLESDLLKSIATVGMTGANAKIHDLENKGVDPKQLERLRDLAEAARKVESAWGTVEEFNPTETWERQLEGLDTLLEDGRISWEQYAKGVAKAGKQLQDASGIGPLKTVGGALKDSSAAVSAVIRAQLSDRVQADPAAELRRAQSEQKEIQKKQLEVAEKMLAAIQEGNEGDDWEAI